MLEVDEMQLAGWKMEAPECFVDVFHIKNGDIPLSC